MLGTSPVSCHELQVWFTVKVRRSTTRGEDFFFSI